MNIKCKYCGYEWVTKSNMVYVSCPSCMKKIKREVDLNEVHRTEYDNATNEREKGHFHI